MVRALLPLLLAAAAGCGPGDTRPAATATEVRTLLVVLGNEPLDDDTPTVDMAARVSTAAAFAREHPGTLLLFTGGPTAGNISEARMMADLAIAQGVSADSIRLEEQARSTQENARLSAAIARELAPRRVLVVSKDDHLEWAMPIFRKVDAFSRAEPLPCMVSRADSIAQMEEYLKRRDNPRVRERMLKLQNGTRGAD